MCCLQDNLLRKLPAGTWTSLDTLHGQDISIHFLVLEFRSSNQTAVPVLCESLKRTPGIPGMQMTSTLARAQNPPYPGKGGIGPGQLSLGPDIWVLYFAGTSQWWKRPKPYDQQVRGTSLVVQWLRCHTPNANCTGLIPGRGNKVLNAVQHGLFIWRRKWQPTPVFLPGESHGQRSLAGHGSWGCKELDMTEQTHTHTHTHTHTQTAICLDVTSKFQKSCKNGIRNFLWSFTQI